MRRGHDQSHGYEEKAAECIAGRSRSTVGAAEVREWAYTLPRGGSVLDLGCGCGIPITRALVDQGLSGWGVDASPSMIAAFQAAFPGSHAECNTIEASDFFSRQFDGAVAWGLMFLLPPESQRLLIRKVAAALKPTGQFLFTSPKPVCEWRDNLTGTPSRSLGAEEYRRLLVSSGLEVFRECDDEGENHYYFSRM